MTSEQDMKLKRRWSALSRAIVVMAWAYGALGCQSQERLSTPRTFTSPYPAPKLWAVVPFRNESGVTVVDTVAFADHLTQQIQQIENIDILPVNRVLEGMKLRRMAEVRSVDQAMALMDTLGVDGLLVGVITAWDPYNPPKIGVSVQLYNRRTAAAMSVEDTRRLTSAGTDSTLPGLAQSSQPAAKAGDYYDAANHNVLANLQVYATGRVPTDSPAGWRRYLNNMDLYGEFVCHELLRSLFAAEWDRLTVPRNAAIAKPKAPAPAGASEAEKKISR